MRRAIGGQLASGGRSTGRAGGARCGARTSGKRHGFALIAAIWLVVMLSSLGLEITTLAHTRRVTAANAIEEERARAAADAGVEHARSRLVRVQADPTLATAAADGFPSTDPWYRSDRLLTDTIAIGEERYHVTLSDANARLNVNVASETQMQRVFAALRIDAGVASRLAQSIVDWRDEDSLPHAGGAEGPTYIKNGLPGYPRNAPLVRVAELRDLYGMTPALFDAIAPHLTVRGSGQVNLNTARRPVLLSLPGFSEPAVAGVLALRARGVAISSIEQLAAALPHDVGDPLVQMTGELLPLVTFQTREVEFASEGWLQGSPVRARVTGLFVRAGGSLFVIGKRSEQQ